MKLNIVQETDSMILVTLAGSLNLDGTQEIEKRFLDCIASRQKHAIVDLSGVDFMASYAMTMLIKCAKGLEATGARMVLLHPQPPIQTLLEAAGIDRLLPIAHERDQAIKLVESG